MIKYFAILFFTVTWAAPTRQPVFIVKTTDSAIPFYDRNYAWVDSLMQVMTVDEKIGQLFMVAAYSNEKANAAEIETLIKKYNIGGLIFMQGSPVKQARLTNTYQSASKIPLLIAMDAEWGPAMRLDSVMSFQRQLTWGAVQDDSLIYYTGKEIARQLKRLGVQVNFAPVIDVNNNADNPVIGDRSFGENKMNVTLKGLMYMNALQENGILACGKHFPGHGDVSTDSHLTLPVINKSKQQLDTLELYPFKVLMNEGLGSIMLAHLFIPSLDSTKNLASSLSKKVGRDLLRDSLGFRGLVFSDALNMKGVSAYYETGELEVKAFLAGNDFLLFSQNVPVAFAAIKNAVANGTISMQRLDESVIRILKAKAFCGLNRYEPVKIQNLYFDLNTKDAELLKRKITEKSITLVHAKDTLIPFKQIDSINIATLSIGDGSKTNFQNYIAKYAKAKQFVLDKNADSTKFNLTFNNVKNADAVIIGIHDMVRSASKDFGITQNTIDIVKKLAEQTQVIVVLFGSPYALNKFESAQFQIVAYDDEEYTQQCVAEGLFGAIQFKGRLPVSSGIFSVNEGLNTIFLQRLKYSIPEETGINSDNLLPIDTIVKTMMQNEAAPGCQIVIAKDGKIIFDKAYGYFTYAKSKKVDVNNLYDLASLTKICATTIALMKLYDDSLFFLNKKIADYLPDTKGSAIENIKMNDLLTHQAGLVSWIPFYKKTLNTDGTLNALYYNQYEIPGFNIKVADKVFLRNDYPDTMWQIIKDTPLKEKNKYVYSDITMYIGKRIFEKLSGEKLDAYMQKNFYSQLGMQTTLFNPLNTFSKDKIVPTENDEYFRYQLIQGYVHDMGAAMAGGVEGHAGLFSDAEDIAILFQMLLNGGSYGGIKYLNASTIELFTSKQSTVSRRGLGFDKPETNSDKASPCSMYASPQAYGHQGFTGTSVWVDPKYNLIYIFLSNRVYPKAEPNKLAAEGTRNKIMDVIYEAMLNSGIHASGTN